MPLPPSTLDQLAQQHCQWPECAQEENPACLSCAQQAQWLHRQQEAEQSSTQHHTDEMDNTSSSVCHPLSHQQLLIFFGQMSHVPHCARWHTTVCTIFLAHPSCQTHSPQVQAVHPYPPSVRETWTWACMCDVILSGCSVILSLNICTELSHTLSCLWSCSLSALLRHLFTWVSLLPCIALAGQEERTFLSVMFNICTVLLSRWG